MLSTEELEEQLVGAISRSAGGTSFCATLSGGVDSTLLAAVAKKSGLEPDLVAYTAVTGAGDDLRYAEGAAAQLGLALRKVEIPTGNAALDLFDELSEKAGEPLDLVGNSIGFAAIARAALNDGFDAVLTGQGAGAAVAGNPTALPTWISECEKLGRQDLIDNMVRVYGSGTVNSAKRKTNRFSSIGDAIIHYSQVEPIKWFGQPDVVARAVGLKALSPYLDKDLCALFAQQPVEWFSRDGWLKSPLRRLLATYVDHGIAYRKDQQGLRWPKRSGLAGCEPRMRRKIAGAGVLSRMSPIERMAFHLGLTRTGQLARLYKIATKRTLEVRGEQPRAS